MTSADAGNELSTVAGGLAAKPAYLLIFGVSFLFATGSGAGFTAGLTNSVPVISVTSAVVFVIALISCLVTAYKAITLGEQRALVMGDLGPAVQAEDETGPVPDGKMTVAFPASLDADFRNATETLLVGIHQSHILIRYYDVIQEKLSKGGPMRVLLLDPECGAGITMTAMRFPGGAPNRQEQSRVESSLAKYLAIQQRYPNLEIRVIPFLLPYGGFLFNWSTDEATAYVQRYTFRVQGGALKPKFFHKGAGNQWLQLYRTEMLAMWDAATPARTADT